MLVVSKVKISGCFRTTILLIPPTDVTGTTNEWIVGNRNASTSFVSVDVVHLTGRTLEIYVVYHKYMSMRVYLVNFFFILLDI